MAAIRPRRFWAHASKKTKALRDQLEVVTKCDIVAPVGRYESAGVKHYNTSAAHIAQSIENSLTDMAIDHIDLLLIHRPDPFMDHHETGRALDDAVKSGKVRAVGVSNFKPWDWTLLQSAMETKLGHQPDRNQPHRPSGLHQWRSGLSSGTRPSRHGVVAAGRRQR